MIKHRLAAVTAAILMMGSAIPALGQMEAQMSENKILIEEVPNKAMRIYHTTARATPSATVGYGDHGFMGHASSSAPAVTLALVAALEGSPGVSGGWLQGYKITVLKAELFTWDEVEPRVIEAIKEVLYPGVEDVEVRTGDAE